MMCGGLVLAAPGTPLQVLIATLIMLIHLLVILKMSPFESDGEDMSSFVSSLALTLTTIGGIVLMMDHPDPDQKAFGSDTLAYILVAISLLCLVSQIGITVFIDCGLLEHLGGTRICKSQNREEADKSSKKGRSNVSVVPVVPPEPPKTPPPKRLITKQNLAAVRQKHGAGSLEYQTALNQLGH